jgi:hypothetical protein
MFPASNSMQVIASEYMLMVSVVPVCPMWQNSIRMRFKPAATWAKLIQ